MMRLSATLALLWCALPAFADDAPPVPAIHKAITPLVNESTVLIVYVDLAQVDAGAWFDEFLQLMPNDNLKNAKAGILARLGELRDAKVGSVYAVVDLADLLRGPAAFVAIPLAQGADAGKITELLPPMAGFSTKQVRGLLVFASTAVHESLADRKTSARPDLAAGWNLAKGTATAVMALPADTRRALGETLKVLPEEVGGGSGKMLADGLKVVALGFDGPSPLKINLKLEAGSEEMAGQWSKAISATVKSLGTIPDASGQPFSETYPKLYREIARQLKPATNGTQITLEMAGGKELLGDFTKRVRGAADSIRSINNLKQMALAMHNYHNIFQALPLAGSRKKDDKNGKPLLSWRVSILPYLGEQKLYESFKLDEPWDSDHNKKLIAKMPKIYASPLADKLPPGRTTYQVPVGPDTIFSPNAKQGAGIAAIADGTSNTIMIVETADDEAVIWTKPDDWQFDPKKPTRGLRDARQGQAPVAFADGSVRWLGLKLKSVTWAALFTAAGGETIDLP